MARDEVCHLLSSCRNSLITKVIIRGFFFFLRYVTKRTLWFFFEAGLKVCSVTQYHGAVLVPQVRGQLRRSPKTCGGQVFFFLRCLISGLIRQVTNGSNGGDPSLLYMYMNALGLGIDLINMEQTNAESIWILTSLPRIR